MIKDLYSNRNIAHTLIFVHHSLFPAGTSRRTIFPPFSRFRWIHPFRYLGLVVAYLNLCNRSLELLLWHGLYQTYCPCQLGDLPFRLGTLLIPLKFSWFTSHRKTPLCSGVLRWERLSHGAWAVSSRQKLTVASCWTSRRTRSVRKIFFILYIIERISNESEVFLATRLDN